MKITRITKYMKFSINSTERLQINWSTFAAPGLQEIWKDYTQASKTNKITGIVDLTK